MSDITSIATSPGGGAQNPAATWSVRTAVGQPPLRTFELRLYLRLPTGGADRVLIDRQATLLSGQFQAITYDARGGAAPGGPATLSGLDSTTLLVALDAPLRVTRVTLAGGTAGGVAHTLEFYRLDKQRRADDPTVSAGVAANTERADLQPDDFTDLRFALRLKRTGTDSYANLAPGQLATLQVQTRPTSPRIGLALAGSTDAPLFFWQAPGELAPSAPERTVAAGPAFADALQSQVDRALDAARDQVSSGALAQLPAFFDFALVIQSDAACDLALSALQVPYRLLQESFPAGAPKQVLRFAGQRADAQQLQLSLPAGATVHAASLRAVESFRAERPATSASAPEIDPVPPQRQAVRLDVGTWLAQPFTPPQALSLLGCAIAVMALAAPAELTLELQEDWHGLPSGRRLAAASISLENAGQPIWARFPFAAPVLVPAQGHWLVIQAARGVALCLLDAGAAPARLLEHDAQGVLWQERQVFDSQALLHRLLTPPQQAGGSATAAPPAPFSLAIGAELVDGTPGPGGSRSFDLTVALQHFLAAGALSQVPLTFIASAPGLLTVYPPRIEYSI